MFGSRLGGDGTTIRGCSHLNPADEVGDGIFIVLRHAWRNGRNDHLMTIWWSKKDTTKWLGSATLWLFLLHPLPSSVTQTTPQGPRIPTCPTIDVAIQLFHAWDSKMEGRPRGWYPVSMLSYPRLRKKWLNYTSAFFSQQMIVSLQFIKSENIHLAK